MPWRIGGSGIPLRLTYLTGPIVTDPLAWGRRTATATAVSAAR